MTAGEKSESRPPLRREGVMVKAIWWSCLSPIWLCPVLLGPRFPFDNSLPAEAKKGLAKAETIELFLLDPRRKPTDKDAAKQKDRFCGWGVQSSVKVTDKGKRKELVASIEKAVADSRATEQRMCFYPHHGLRAVGGGKTVEMIICFQCRRIQVYVDEALRTVATTRDPEDILDKLLEGKKVPVPPRPPKSGSPPGKH